MGNVDELIQKYKEEAGHLSLTPDPRVWENVDREINGGKRKKRFFFIFFLLGCGLAYGLFTANSYFNRNTTAGISTKIKTQHPEKTVVTHPNEVSNPSPELITTQQNNKHHNNNSNSNKRNTTFKLKTAKNNLATDANPGILVGHSAIDRTKALRPKPLVAMPLSRAQHLAATVNPFVVQVNEPIAPEPAIAQKTPGILHSNGTNTKRATPNGRKVNKTATAHIAKIPMAGYKRLAANNHPTIPTPIASMATPDPSIYVAKAEEKKWPKIIEPQITQIPVSAYTELSAALKPASPASVIVNEFEPYISDTIAEPFIPLPPPYENDAPRTFLHIASLPVIAHQQLTASIGWPVMQATFIQTPEINTLRINEEFKKDTILRGIRDTSSPRNTPASRKNRWAISFNGASAANNKTISEAGDYQFVKHYRDSTDKRLVSINYSAGLHYSVSKRLRLDLGFGFNKTGERINSRQVVYKADTLTLTKMGTIYSLSAPPTVIIVGKKFYDINNDSTGHINNYVSYLTITAGFTYFMQPGNKFRIGLQPALAASKLFSSNSYYYNNQDSTYSKAGSAQLRPWVVCASLGIPFEYSFTKKLMASVTPYYSAFLTPVYSSAQTVTTQYGQSGVKLSVAWMFR